jgi:hypothetical protein
MGISTGVNDPNGTENQQYWVKIRRGTAIVKRRVGRVSLGKSPKKA